MPVGRMLCSPSSARCAVEVAVGRTSDRAVVLGSSLSGLLAAKVLNDAHRSVTLVERDELPSGPEHRRGSQQSRHAHGLLAGGLAALEDLLPGLTEDLLAQGAVPGDNQLDCRWYNDGWPLRRRASPLRGLAVSRPLLDAAVRARVLSLPGVELLPRTDAVGLTVRDGRVTGARVHHRSPGSTQTVLPAEVVVDATGRGSRTPAWLAAEGYQEPHTSTITIGLGCSSVVLPRRPGDVDGDVAVVVGATPAVPRGAAALAMEGDRWIVTLGGYEGDHPPTDQAGMRAFAASLASDEIVDLLTAHVPLGPASTYRFPSSRRRHYERLGRLPEGLVVVGDALCSFNPVYGQGMAVCAIEAQVLREVLRSGPADCTRTFFRRAARVVEGPWQIAAGGDLRLPVVPGPRPPQVRLVNRYVSQVQAAAAVDPEVGLAFLRVANLLDPPQALLRPAVAGRVLAASMRLPHQRGGDRARPAVRG
jgi:2-polyprenyl-6-methoxyphenol hydroxylase-like FAD-dependent oxidoreductase